MIPQQSPYGTINPHGIVNIPTPKQSQVGKFSPLSSRVTNAIAQGLSQNQEGRFSPLSARPQTGQSAESTGSGGLGIFGPLATAVAAAGQRGLSALGSRVGRMFEAPSPEQATSPAAAFSVPQGASSFYGVRGYRPTGNFPGNTNSNLLDQFSMNQIGQSMAAPYQLVNSINNSYRGMQEGISRYNDRLDRSYDRGLARQALASRERMFNSLSRALLGGGAAEGQGVYDTNSPLRIGGDGSVSTAITARGLPLSSILRADNAVRNTPAGVRSNFPMTPQARQELEAMMQGRLREVAPNVERDLINVNSPFSRAVQVARGNQFQQLAALQAALRGDEIYRQGANVRTLMQLIGG